VISAIHRGYRLFIRYKSHQFVDPKCVYVRLQFMTFNWLVSGFSGLIVYVYVRIHVSDGLR